MSYDDELSINTSLENEEHTSEPPKSAVIFLNDDYTPMEFVVAVLMKIFNHSSDIAHSLMLEVHQSGQAIAGIYTNDIAETKATQVNTLAEENRHPLRSIIQPINT